MIDNTYSNTTGSTLTMDTPSTLTNLQYSRLSVQNYQLTTYTLNFTQPQILSSGSIIIITVKVNLTPST